MEKARLEYTLRLADDALIIGQRLGEWCGHGPILEQDIALTNTSLDHIGRARSLYQYAAEQFNDLPAEDKRQFFSSIALQNIISSGKDIDEDMLAYLRDGWDFRNLLLLEQPNMDWAFTVARSFFYDAFNCLFFDGLQSCKDESLAAIAEKSLKEATYHLRWSSEWVIRLGDGTDESHTRMQNAINELWMYTGELFFANETDRTLLDLKLAVDPSTLRHSWTDHVNTVLAEATLKTPAAEWMQQGGREGRHTEHLGYILADMQFLQRTYPNMAW